MILLGQAADRLETQPAARAAGSGAPSASGSVPAVPCATRFAIRTSVRPSLSRDVRWIVRSIAKCRRGPTGTRRRVVAEDDSST